MDVTAMRQVGEFILAEPRKFNMRALWIEPISSVLAASLHHAKSAIPPCGTVACFAGEWAIRTGYESEVLSLESGYNCGEMCRESLNLPNNDLFLESSWPMRLQTTLKAGTRAYAEHFVKVVLEDYIANNGWENLL